MSEEVTRIINALCEKLGVAANILVPEIAKYYIARLITSIIIDSVVLIVSVAVLVQIVKCKHPKSEDMDPDDALFVTMGKALVGVVPTIAIIVMLICLHDDITHLVGWLASPTAAAIKEITGMIK